MFHRVPFTCPHTVKLASEADGLRNDLGDETLDEYGRHKPINFQPLIAASRDVGAWLLDVARSRSTDPDDLAAIERVERAFHGHYEVTPAGVRTRASEEDILTVLGVLITVFEVDFRIPGLGLVAGSIYDATDGDLDRIKRFVTETLADRTAERIATAVVRGASLTPGLLRVAVRRAPKVAHAVDEDLSPRSAAPSIFIVG